MTTIPGHALTVDVLHGQQAVIHPRTGELVELNAPTDLLADLVDALDERSRQIKEVASTIRGELLQRMDREATWTHRVEVGGRGYKLTAPSPTAGTVEYDAKMLRDRLLLLVADDVVGEQAAAAAVDWVHPEPYLKVNAAGVKRLEKIGDERVAAAIQAARRTVPTPNRTVRVSMETGS